MDYANTGRQYSGYVRFIRGTPTAWNNLEKKDENTLYFISEKDANSGLLYLGSKLISGSGDISISPGKTSLNKLTDVALNLNIKDGSVLTFDKKTGKWIDKVIEIQVPEIEIPEVNIEVFKGATQYMAGKKGLVPAPFEGQHTYYLKGDGSWSNPTEALEVELLLLRQGDKGSIRSIAASEVLKVLGANVPEKYNTIEKIANWIVTNGTSVDSADGAKRLEELEKSVYGDDKTSQTNGLVAVTSSLQEIINGSANVTGLVAITSRLDIDNVVIKNDISQLKKQYNSLNTTVNGLSERLRWQNI